MGHGHEEPFKVPHYTNYSNWQRIEPLVEHQKRLQRIGLSDPWIRNIMHHFDSPHPMGKSYMKHIYDILKPGIKPGVTIAATIIAIEEGYQFLRYGHTSWSHH